MTFSSTTTTATTTREGAPSSANKTINNDDDHNNDSNSKPTVVITPSQLQAWRVSLSTLVKECSESSNPYLQKFASSPLATKFLEDDRVIGCFGRKNRSFLRKELLEAAALESKIERIFNSTTSKKEYDNDNQQQQQKLIIWDLCSGKGFSSVWLSVNTYPNATIHLVDTDTKTNRDYLEAFPNLIYHNLDLYSNELEELIRESCCCYDGSGYYSSCGNSSTTGDDDDGGGGGGASTTTITSPYHHKRNAVVVLLVGIHLCGDLSRRALELRFITGANAAVISPCCAMRSKIKPKKRRKGSFGYNVPQMARQLKVVTPYDLWCWMLWGYACSTTAAAAADDDDDDDDDTDADVASSSSPSNNDNNNNLSDNKSNNTDATRRRYRRHRHRLDLTDDPLMRTDKNKWLMVVDEKM